jgi:hypothetical protein
LARAAGVFTLASLPWRLNPGVRLPPRRLFTHLVSVLIQLSSDSHGRFFPKKNIQKILFSKTEEEGSKVSQNIFYFFLYGKNCTFRKKPALNFYSNFKDTKLIL